MTLNLYDYQQQAIENLSNGSILCGGVGSGKSITALAYYLIKECDGMLKMNGKGKFKLMSRPRDLYIITTARKRDTLEWHKECAKFILWPDEEEPQSNAFGVKVEVDSWNNIKKYQKVSGAFFIFDEQRVIGSGAWVKSFLNITRKNHWILLSATPGDTWSDYIPVFIANGFYQNKSEFEKRHCVYSRFSKYPKIERYIDEEVLERYRDKILVTMKDPRTTVRHEIGVKVEYDKLAYRKVMRDHWDVFENCPIEETGKWVYLLRRVVNSDESRIKALDEIIGTHPKLIIFYNFNYELELLRKYLNSIFYFYTEWNGQKHEEILHDKDEWAYLVQYTAGAEGWNCIETNAIVFFSQNYSYRIMEQATGRIDRINTPFSDLFYYHLRSVAPIDLAIRKAIRDKRNFNEASFCRRGGR